MSDQTQLDRIETKLDLVIKDGTDHRSITSRHGADIAWLKRLVGGLGTGVIAVAAHLLRKVGL